MQPVQEVATPGQKTIADLSAFLGIAPNKTLKAVFYAVGGEIIFCVIRGDLEINEVKLVQHSAPRLEPGPGLARGNSRKKCGQRGWLPARRHR